MTPPPPLSDRLQIENVLQQYQAAYRQLDAAAVRSLWPSITVSAFNQLTKNFAQYRSGDLQLEAPAISIDGANAQATSAATVSFVPEVGKPVNQRIVATFRLRKVAGAWVIESFESRRR